ncbi:MAG: cardiolipin synthase [Porphyromonadaceae bacterium]|nr:cardiolipin synthase [Porphyromonadaceae bacterium]
MEANHWGIWMTLTALYGITILGVIGTVLSENRNPLKATAWVLIVIFIPIVGLMAYILFGQDQRRLSRLSKQFYQRLMRAPLQLSIPRHLSSQVQLLDEQERLINLLEHSADSPLLSLESVEVFAHGEAMYASLMEDIAWAKQHIHLQAYIFDEDDLLDELEELLTYKASQGVEVRIIYDYLGSYSVSLDRWERMKLAGMQIYPFMKVAIPLLSSTVNYRNHRKVAIIDGHTGYVGGMNFAERYRSGNNLGAWRDTHFRIEGDAVAALQSAFLLDWYSVSRRVLNLEQCFVERDPSTRPAYGYVQFVLGGPMSPWTSIEQAMIAMVAQAKRHICIQTPYFLPTEALQMALIIASLSGVRVELMLPKRGDSWAATHATASYIDELLSSGIEVYFYEAGFLHSKLLVVDGNISAIGSANMDFRSLEHNFEITGVVYGEALGRQLEELFEQDKAGCTRVEPERWQARSRRRKLAESVMRLFSPAM